MPKDAKPPAPGLAELAAEVARLRLRVEKLERARAAALPPVAPSPVPTRRNSAFPSRGPRALIEPGEPWNLAPPGLKGRDK